MKRWTASIITLAEQQKVKFHFSLWFYQEDVWLCKLNTEISKVTIMACVNGARREDAAGLFPNKMNCLDIYLDPSVNVIWCVWYAWPHPHLLHLGWMKWKVVGIISIIGCGHNHNFFEKMWFGLGWEKDNEIIKLGIYFFRVKRERESEFSSRRREFRLKFALGEAGVLGRNQNFENY